MMNSTTVQKHCIRRRPESATSSLICN